MSKLNRVWIVEQLVDGKWRMVSDSFPTKALAHEEKQMEKMSYPDEIYRIHPYYAEPDKPKTVWDKVKRRIKKGKR